MLIFVLIVHPTYLSWKYWLIIMYLIKVTTAKSHVLLPYLLQLTHARTSAGKLRTMFIYHLISFWFTLFFLWNLSRALISCLYNYLQYEILPDNIYNMKFSPTSIFKNPSKEYSAQCWLSINTCQSSLPMFSFLTQATSKIYLIFIQFKLGSTDWGQRDSKPRMSF